MDAHKTAGESPPNVRSPKKVASPAKKEISPLKRESFRQKDVSSPKQESPQKKDITAQKKMIASDEHTKGMNSPPKRETIQNKEGSLPNIDQAASVNESNVLKMTSTSDEQKEVSTKIVTTSPSKSNISTLKIGLSLSIEDTVISQKKYTSPPTSTPKLARMESKTEDGSIVKLPKRENPVTREAPLKAEKLSLIANDVGVIVDKNEGVCETNTKSESEQQKGEEWNGVGDKIKIFEKAASEASNGGGRVSRSGSIRLRVRSDRSITEIEEELPPATPFKDSANFDIPSTPNDRSLTSIASNSVNTLAARWQRSDVTADTERPRPEPQKLIKPEFKPISSSADVTIRSPSLGAKIADRFPSHGTAFRNVASPDTSRTRDTLKSNDETAINDFRTCKFRNKERHSTGKSGGYYTRGSEEIWLVKKKDIEEIEERVLDSFRRAGGGCARPEPNRSSHEAAQGASGRRHAYARSESHDPTWSVTRAQTLKRQTSVACTCGHDRKTRARTQQAEPSTRPRSRSHGDDTEQTQVLDKYETLV